MPVPWSARRHPFAMSGLHSLQRFIGWSYVAAASEDGVVKIWNACNGSARRHYRGLHAYILWAWCGAYTLQRLQPMELQCRQLAKTTLQRLGMQRGVHADNIWPGVVALSAVFPAEGAIRLATPFSSRQLHRRSFLHRTSSGPIWRFQWCRLPLTGALTLMTFN